MQTDTFKESLDMESGIIIANLQLLKKEKEKENKEEYILLESPVERISNNNY